MHNSITHKDHESGRKGSRLGRDQCPGSKRVNKLRKVGPLETETLFTSTRLGAGLRSLVHDGDIDAPKILMEVISA